MKFATLSSPHFIIFFLGGGEYSTVHISFYFSASAYCRIGAELKLSFQSTEGVIFIYHHCGCISIYRPLSYPLIFLANHRSRSICYYNGYIINLMLHKILIYSNKVMLPAGKNRDTHNHTLHFHPSTPTR